MDVISRFNESRLSVLKKMMNPPTPFKRRDSNVWDVHTPEAKSSFGDIMRHRLFGEYLECLHKSEGMTYLDTENINSVYQLPTDIKPEFLKMEDYLNQDCYPKPTDNIVVWSRYPHIPQLTGLPECPTSTSHTTAPKPWHLEKKTS